MKGWRVSTQLSRLRTGRIRHTTNALQDDNSSRLDQIKSESEQHITCRIADEHLPLDPPPLPAEQLLLKPSGSHHHHGCGKNPSSTPQKLPIEGETRKQIGLPQLCQSTSLCSSFHPVGPVIVITSQRMLSHQLPLHPMTIAQY